jgi:hypothetical protein
MSELLSHEQILAALERPEVNTEVVHVPELGGPVRVREMSGHLRNRLEATYAAIQSGGDGKTLDAVTVQLIAMCVVDEKDRPLLTANEAKRLMAARPRAAFRLRDAILKLSATDEDDVEALAEVFGDGPNGPSTSD